MKSLRTWTETKIEEEVNLKGETHENALFYGCELSNIRNAVLKDCCLSESKLTATKLSELAGATVTLNCHTFSDLHMSRESLEFFLMLLCRTKGNDEMRQNIIDHVIGRERAKQLLRSFRIEL